MESKAWWQSKTIWGSIISVIALGLNSFGFTLGTDDQQMLVDTILQLVTAGGAGLAIYGRVKASKSIG